MKNCPICNKIINKKILAVTDSPYNQHKYIRYECLKHFIYCTNINNDIYYHLFILNNICYESCNYKLFDLNNSLYDHTFGTTIESDDFIKFYNNIYFQLDISDAKNSINSIIEKLELFLLLN